MKTKSILSTSIIALVFSISQLFAQKPNFPNPIEIFVPTPAEKKIAKVNINQPSFYQQKENWQKIIDSTWGPGDTYEKKLEIFDTYVKALDDNYPCFPNLSFNWDSLKTYYRNEIDSATSR
ncbi:MAG: hypothetical protein H6611_08555, partial [Ignavibacteriales bacterium]|nr:hypothetical protein [Ignavibacteriales bacterium]